MSDLISRKAVYEMLHGLGGCDASDEWSKGWDKAIDSAIKELDKIPTAYGVDKVIELMESLKANNEDAGREIDKFIRNQHIDICISIVKGAVKDE